MSVMDTEVQPGLTEQGDNSPATPEMALSGTGHEDCADMQPAADDDCPCPEILKQLGQCCDLHKACSATAVFVLSDARAAEMQDRAVKRLFGYSHNNLIGVAGQLATPPPKA
ncbi:MAG: hypothetical protein Alpg2KO_21180 [Alphaproteobacteria bacterium]